MQVISAEGNWVKSAERRRPPDLFMMVSKTLSRGFCQIGLPWEYTQPGCTMFQYQGSNQSYSSLLLTQDNDCNPSKSTVECFTIVREAGLCSTSLRIAPGLFISWQKPHQAAESIWGGQEVGHKTAGKELGPK